MDPYLEIRWGDVHASLSVYSSDAFNRGLPSGLVARSEKRTVAFIPYATHRDIVPDVGVIERETKPMTGGSPATTLAESACLMVPESVEITQRYLEIRDIRSGGRVVTVIEFVSPTNKRPGDGLVKYQQKQQECIDGDVNLVEIDLTRSGDRDLILPTEHVDPVTPRNCDTPSRFDRR